VQGGIKGGIILSALLGSQHWVESFLTLEPERERVGGGWRRVGEEGGGMVVISSRPLGQPIRVENPRG